MYFLNTLFLLTRHGSDKRSDSNVASNEDQLRVYQNFKFHDPRTGIFVLGRGHESHIVKMHYFLLLKDGPAFLRHC